MQNDLFCQVFSQIGCIFSLSGMICPAIYVILFCFLNALITRLYEQNFENSNKFDEYLSASNC